MPTITFIGDAHGKYKQYGRIIRDRKNTIQVGDMGVGFRRCGGARDGEFYSNPPHARMVEGGHRFIRGNHDNPGACRTQSQWIPDGCVEGDMMFVGGALSIDRQWRTEGFDWWADEELSIAELQTIVDIYTTVRPRIMVTHECPESAADHMCKVAGWTKVDMPSRTRQAFQVMFELHQPDIWIHGHWHMSFDRVLEGTRFICLDELECLDIDV